METGVLPFFVEWEGDADGHPGAAAAEHDADPEGIAWIELRTDDEERLREWLGEDADLPLRITEGDPCLSAVAIATAGGEVVVRG
jgi:hypothetical protein